jgi:RNA polymerase sigma-70 factor (ECF subfamily)
VTGYNAIVGDAGRAEVERTFTAQRAAGDLSAAATTAVQGYGSEILGYLMAVARTEADAREVFAQFCEDLWRGLAGFRGEAALRTWAYKLAWHALQRHARDPYRKRGRRLETTEGERLARSVHSSTVRQSEAIRRLRESLEPAEQTLLVLRVDRELGWDEVAGVMGVKEVVLRKRFERLKEKLKNLALAAGLLDGR